MHLGGSPNPPLRKVLERPPSSDQIPFRDQVLPRPDLSTTSSAPTSLIPPQINQSSIEESSSVDPESHLTILHKHPKHQEENNSEGHQQKEGEASNFYKDENYSAVSTTINTAFLTILLQLLLRIAEFNNSL